MIFNSQSEFLEKISKWNFKTNPLSKVLSSLDEIEEQHKKIDKKVHY